MRPSRYLMVLAALFVVLYGLVLVHGPGSWSERLKPKLGLDLVGGTSLTLVASTRDGKPPSPTRWNRPATSSRAGSTASAWPRPRWSSRATRNIIINVPGQNSDTIRQVGKPAQLRFRKVIKTTDAVGVVLDHADADGAQPRRHGSASTTAPAPTTPRRDHRGADRDGDASGRLGLRSTPARVQRAGRRSRRSSARPPWRPPRRSRTRRAVLADSGPAQAARAVRQADPGRGGVLPPQLQFNVPTRQL